MRTCRPLVGVPQLAHAGVVAREQPAAVGRNGHGGDGRCDVRCRKRRFAKNVAPRRFALRRRLPTSAICSARIDFGRAPCPAVCRHSLVPAADLPVRIHCRRARRPRRRCGRCLRSTLSCAPVAASQMRTLLSPPAVSSQLAVVEIDGPRGQKSCPSLNACSDLPVCGIEQPGRMVAAGGDDLRCRRAKTRPTRMASSCPSSTRPCGARTCL